jgi:hypothetical protein
VRRSFILCLHSLVTARLKPLKHIHEDNNKILKGRDNGKFLKDLRQQHEAQQSVKTAATRRCGHRDTVASHCMHLAFHHIMIQGFPTSFHTRVNPETSYSQSPQLTFLCNQGRSLWETRRDLAFEGDRPSAEVPKSAPTSRGM